VTEPEQPQVRVGVVLPPHPDDLADWLADGGAFESAGADALWVETEPEAGLDPLALTAALAAMTFRSLLVAQIDSPSLDDIPTPGLDRTLATIARLSRGRLRLATGSADERVLSTPDNAGGGEVWLRLPSPENRAAWRESIANAIERGHHQVVVVANPRLLDMLRNPDEPDDRRDLYLAQG